MQQDVLLEMSLQDLRTSGLSSETINLLNIETYRAPDKLNGRPITGYKIPYFDTEGAPLQEGLEPFYRIKLLPPLRNGFKYLQPPDTSTHVYLPPNTDPKNWFDRNRPLVITEGEKKAAKACQEGILCAALGGIQNWHCKNLKFPLESVRMNGVRSKHVTLENLGPQQQYQIEESVAPELTEISLSLEDREVYVCFDNDTDPKAAAVVQASVFELSCWLAAQGAVVKQILLPSSSPKLDDFLVAQGEEGFAAFWGLPQVPYTHPSPKLWIQRTLNRTKGNRRATDIQIATAVVNQLDVEGQRYASAADDSFYYFDAKEHQLHPFQLSPNSLREIRLSTFGDLLSRRFGVDTTDSLLMGRISDRFASGLVGSQVPRITPRRISYCTANALYYQLSDSSMAKVSAEAIEVLPNGTDNVLFLTKQVEPIPLADLQPLLAHPALQQKEPLWFSVLNTVNLQPFPNFTIEETQTLISALFYLNPLFRRWRGLMLPIELIIAEPNAGKTFLYNLRQLVLTGRPSLKNPPLSPKDWYSQIVNAAGMWVCDNFGDPPQEIKTLISDELARLTTDPDPKIEMRQLYTNTDLGRYSIDCTFAITAIRNPFWKPDILQRSIAINLAAIPRGQRNSGWYDEQLLRAGGRSLWIAEHLSLAQKFLKETQLHFDPNYLSEHRLVHFEQSLQLMGRAFGPPYSGWMASALRKFYGVINHQISSGDPVLEGLKAFSNENFDPKRPHRLFKASDIVQWAQYDPESRFSHLKIFGNPIQLGKYMAHHAYDIAETCGISTVDRHNRTYYRIDKENLSDS